MPNPNPVLTPEFIAAQRTQKYPDEPLSDKVITIRFKRSVDKKLRAIPEYSGLVRDCVDKYFDDLTNPQPVAPARVSTDDESEEPLSIQDLYEWYGGKSEPSKTVVLPFDVLTALTDVERLKKMGFTSIHHFLCSAITDEAKRRGLV